MARDNLAAHWQVPSFADEQGIVDTIREHARHVHIDQVESLWEPTMVLAARLRELLGVPGMTVAQTIPFRDKEEMKRVLDAAGIRTPRHHSAMTSAGVREAALATSASRSSSSPSPGRGPRTRIAWTTSTSSRRCSPSWPGCPR